MSCAGIPPPESRVTASVLQTETGLVSLGHSTSRNSVQQVIITEGIHTVVMPEGVKWSKYKKLKLYFFSCGRVQECLQGHNFIVILNFEGVVVYS